MIPSEEPPITDPPVPLTDRRQIRGAERRDAILVAAVTRFARKGYENTRLRDVASDVGMTDAGLLHHFRTKEDLFTAVVEQHERHYKNLAVGPEATVRDFLDSLAAAVDRHASDPESLRFDAMLTAMSILESQPARDRAWQQFNQAFDSIVPLVERAAVRGEIRTDIDPQQFALETLALVQGLRALWVARPDLVDYVQALRSAFDSRYEAMRTRPSPADD